MSRGWFRIFTFRCPEVRLDFDFEVSRGWIRIWLLGVQRLDSNFHFRVSRGSIITFTFRCPEVGFEFSLDAPPRKASIERRQNSGLGDLTMRVGDRGGGSVLAAKWDPEKEIAVL